MIDDKENIRKEREYNLSKNNFIKQQKLYHFTDFDALRKIFGEMKFNFFVKVKV